VAVLDCIYSRETVGLDYPSRNNIHDIRQRHVEFDHKTDRSRRDHRAIIAGVRMDAKRSAKVHFAGPRNAPDLSSWRNSIPQQRGERTVKPVRISLNKSPIIRSPFFPPLRARARARARSSRFLLFLFSSFFFFLFLFFSLSFFLSFFFFFPFSFFSWMRTTCTRAGRIQAYTGDRVSSSRASRGTRSQMFSFLLPPSRRMHPWKALWDVPLYSKFSLGQKRIVGDARRKSGFKI